jgi:hypothetical protein
MSGRKHIKDEVAGPVSKEAELDTDSFPEGQPMPEDTVESEGEKQAREIERGLDHALGRIPPG